MKHYLIRTTKLERIQELMDARESLERQHLDLICHLTTLDATLLGILTVFQDKLKLIPSLRYPTTDGMILLFLSLVAGIYYMCMAYRVNEKIYLHLVEEMHEEVGLASGAESFPLGTLFAAKVCPICLCLGVLLLLIGVFL